MTKETYRAVLAKLGLTVAGQETGRVLSISIRQSQRYAAGAAEIPPQLAKLLQLLDRRGTVPKAWR